MVIIKSLKYRMRQFQTRTSIEFNVKVKVAAAAGTYTEFVSFGGLWMWLMRAKRDLLYGESGCKFTNRKSTQVTVEDSTLSRYRGDKMNKLKEAPHFAQLGSYAKFANARKRSCRAGKFAANVQEPA